MNALKTGRITSALAAGAEYLAETKISGRPFDRDQFTLRIMASVFIGASFKGVEEGANAVASKIRQAGEDLGGDALPVSVRWANNYARNKIRGKVGLAERAVLLRSFADDQVRVGQFIGILGVMLERSQLTGTLQIAEGLADAFAEEQVGGFP